MSNYQSSLHVIDLKFDIELSPVYCRLSACSPASSAAGCSAVARCAVERSNEYLSTDGAYRRHIVEKVSKRAPSGSIVSFVLVHEIRRSDQVTP